MAAILKTDLVEPLTLKAVHCRAPTGLGWKAALFELQGFCRSLFRVIQNKKSLSYLPHRIVVRVKYGKIPSPICGTCSVVPEHNPGVGHAA